MPSEFSYSSLRYMTEQQQLGHIRTMLEPLSAVGAVDVEAFTPDAVMHFGLLVHQFCKVIRVLTHNRQHDVVEEIVNLGREKGHVILSENGRMTRVDQLVGFCRFLKTKPGQEMVTEAQRLLKRRKRARELGLEDDEYANLVKSQIQIQKSSNFKKRFGIKYGSS